MTRILSVDLAYKRHADIGVALLEANATGIAATLIEPPLPDPPHPHTLADWLHHTAQEHDARGICIDGPLGWKADGTDAPHCRVSEKVVRAPGKTGLPPAGVKPRNYLAFTEFSIALFERLTMVHGYLLPGAATSVNQHRRFITETFPTAAWRALGLAPLPGKGRTKPHDLEAAVERLLVHTPARFSSPPTHDQLQAVVGGLAGLAWAVDSRDRVQLAGLPPFRLDDSWREGYIMIPAP